MNDGAGLLGSARLAFTQALGSRVIATAGVGATFANARQMRWDFGVTQAEASRRQALIAAGDDRLRADEGSAYEPKGGLRNLGASLSLVFLVSRHWALVGFGGADRLSDEAAASPLVRRREQYSGGLGLSYRF
jgi:outer membrane scaffolding protein for murein synthesis (MipA/OmpV family)